LKPNHLGLHETQGGSVAAVSRLVDDRDRPRDPTHSALKLLIDACGLEAVDPGRQPKPVGKEKRVRAVLEWTLTHDVPRGGEFVRRLIAEIRGCGGFRPASPNYVGEDPIANTVDAFRSAGFDLSADGDLRPRLLETLEGLEVTEALRAYVVRIRQGYADAALVVGTGKDLLEATSAHVIAERYGSPPASGINFPTLLGQAFVAVGLATPEDMKREGEPATRNVERRLFELGIAINTLRNKQGTGHGRPFLPFVGLDDARTATEAMAVIAELLLNALRRPPG